MKNSHLVHLLRTFDKKEIKELRKWVSSPAHNLRHDVMLLFEHLSSPEHLSSDILLEKEKVFTVVYPGKTYNDGEMRQSIYFLFRAVENFLVYHELLKDDVRSQSILAKVYRQRQLPKLFERTMETAKNTQERQPYRNHQYYENEYFLQFEQYSYLSGLSRSTPLNLQEVSDANDIAYLANKLQLSCIMLSHQTVFKTEYRMDMLQDLFRQIGASPQLLDIPAIAIYYHQYHSITDPENESHFSLLKTQIIQHGELFPPHEIRVIFLLAINYCIGRNNAGKTAFIRETFELYQQGLQRDIFLENGVLSRFTFGNIVLAALNLKEFAWVENFIREYSSLLEEKHREGLVTFNFARLYFEKKDYSAAMKILSQLNYDDVLINILSKTMLLKMYFELDEFNALDSLLESTSAYLKRKKVSGYHKSNFSNIITYTRKLLKIKPYDKAAREKLRSELQDAAPLTERRWLLEQLEKL